MSLRALLGTDELRSMAALGAWPQVRATHRRRLILRSTVRENVFQPRDPGEVSALL